MHLVHRKTCRLCGSSALTPVINLGSQYLQSAFIKPGCATPSQRKVPLELVRCDPTRDENACGLLQLSCSIPPGILYSSYWYRSGTNTTMRDHLHGIVKSVLEMVPAPHRVMDIGCNDGTLLGNYPEYTYKVGVDPSDIARASAKDFVLFNETFPSPGVSAMEEPFDVITSIAMLYDIEDPVAFARSVSQSLAPDGVWVFEVSHMPTMLVRNSYDTICHEHLEYYSLSVIERLMTAAKLKIVRVETNEINGGSIRCYATHAHNYKHNRAEYDAKINQIRLSEFDMELDKDLPYLQFQSRIESNRKELIATVHNIVKSGKVIHVYGASTKGNTILQYCGLDYRTIQYAADRNPDKHGATTLGSDIPIISEEQSRAEFPDYYLVLPWHFRDEFLARESEIMRGGTRMIFPLPSVEIVGV